MRLHPALMIAMLLSSFAFSNVSLALDCSNPQTQTDINQCASTDLDGETKRLNKIYDGLCSRLNPEQQHLLQETQRAWVEYKNMACKLEASGVEGGSVYSMIVSGCLIKKSRQRIEELESLANCQEGDLSCPAW